MLVSLYVTCYGTRIPKLTGCPLKSARRDSAVLFNRSILLYDKQAISFKTIGEFLVQYPTKRVAVGIQGSAKKFI